MMKKLLIPLVALAAAASAHALTFDVTVSGDMAEYQRPDPDPGSIPLDLDGYRFLFVLEAPSAPTTMLELFAAMSGNEFGSFFVQRGATTWAGRNLHVFKVASGEFGIGAGASNADPANIFSFAWSAIIEDDKTTVVLNDTKNTTYEYLGDVSLSVSQRSTPVPDSGSTAGLMGLALFGALLIRRSRAGSR